MTKILIVDDEDIILKILERELFFDGFDVISAKNGASALVRIYQDRPDLVLLDLLMPVLNGYEVLREIRANTSTKNLPVIVLTGVSDVESEQAAVKLGANYYVTKPWNPETLQAAIRVALREARNMGFGQNGCFLRIGQRQYFPDNQFTPASGGRRRF